MYREIMSGARVLIVILIVNTLSLLASAFRGMPPRQRETEPSDIELGDSDPWDLAKDSALTPVPLGPNYDVNMDKYRQERKELLGI